MTPTKQVEGAAAWEYDCPVCGIELTRSNFDTPAAQYYCPLCATRQQPHLRAAHRSRSSWTVMENVERVMVSAPLAARVIPRPWP